ncbi:hypothetical protein BGX21_003573 [Mortierella sp. AD011]|nr:hypothetical protein BGX20_000151 [Mortierella sp. AD010]KAF9400761.1 hypothetical protein BGX21_003573 [Mortierella sp. AD011]
MDALTPILMNFLEEHARPHVKEKVSEELDETKVELKENLPDSVMEHLKSQDANPMISQVADSMGDKLMEHIRKIINLTVETASEGMDLLLTDGVMNIARGILTEDSDGKGFSLDFLNKGKEGMVETTMVASKPVIKQVSTNIGHKVSTHVPSHIGRAVQEFIDEHGGPNGPMAMVAGLFAKFVGDDDDDEPKKETAGDDRGIDEVDPNATPIQKLLHKMLAPKILDWIQPHMEKFEGKMTTSLEGELRGKVFSVEYIEKTALSMITGVSSGLSGEGGHGIGGLIGGLIQKKLGGDSDDDDDGKKSGGKSDDPMALIGSLATQFLQNREN